MKLKNKFLLGVLTISSVCMILQPNKVNAALQSNGGTSARKTANDWILQIRQMQELGGTLGRTDTVSTTNLISNATDLDIHMEKNTEYGAMAILSASSYGNPNKIEDGDTTTGNSTGIVMNINKEWVAAFNYTDSTNLKNASSRYKNIYKSTYEAKIGDAILETDGWHGGRYQNTWIVGGNSKNGSGLIRAFSGSIFTYYGRGYDNWEADIQVPGYGESKLYTSRACIVVGTGL